MRIALFTDTYPPYLNGVATATYTLKKVLEQNGHQVLVVTISKPNQKHLSYGDGVIRIPGVVLKRIYNYQLARLYSQKAFMLVKDFQPEVIHIQTEMSICIFGRFIAKRLNVPLIYTYHTLYEDYTYYITGGFKPVDAVAKKIIAFMSKIVSDTNTELTTTSNKAKDILVKYGVKKYINVIPIGIDFSMFDYDKIQQDKLNEIIDKYDLKDKFVFLILGRIAKEKSNLEIFDYLSEYLSNHKELIDKVKLLVVGDGPDRENLERAASNSILKDIAIFTKAVKHELVPYFYYIGDLFLSASTSETQGLTFNEAMACKLLVLAKYDKNLTLCIEDGKTGFFFYDKKTFFEKLDLIINLKPEQKQEVISQAYKNNVEKYSLYIFYKRMINVYKRALQRYW